MGKKMKIKHLTDSLIVIMEILVIGGGISGLILAYFLQQNGFECKILERDEDIKGKDQGFSLTMQGPDTKKILEEYKLLDEIYEYGASVKVNTIYDGNGNILHENKIKKTSKKFHYQLPRQKLRDIFYEKLKENTVSWNKKVIDIKCESSIYTITCSDESIYKCNLLFACDGVNSIVRRIFKKEIKLNDFGLMTIYGIVEFDKLKDKNQFKNTSFQILDGKHRLFSKPFNDKYQMWQMNYFSDVDYNDLTKEKCLEITKNIVSNWKIDNIQNFIESTETERIIRHPLLDYIPNDSDVENLENIVFLADSIHAKSPFVGQGANTAIQDSYDFVELLKNNKYIKQVINDYNKKMLVRAKKYVKISRDHVYFLLSEDALNKEKLAKFKGWKN